jgi:uncharacterized protein (DUF924 family)
MHGEGVNENMTDPLPSPTDVLTFWRDAGYDRWYGKDDAFDGEIRTRFMPLWEAARDGKLTEWEKSDDGTLALLIVLDQFPRNMFRNDPRAFSTDPQALAVAKSAIARGCDARVAPELRQFIYLPLMHAENLADQGHCVRLFERDGNELNIRFAIVHADIIRRFGRFPHRNAVLGRVTTPEEAAFLDDGGFKG